MAFSIFKKNEERMAPPKAAKAAPAAVPTRSPEPAVGGGKLPVKPAADELDDDLESLDFTGITIEEEKDPIDAAIEEAAVSFANDNAAHCEAVLKDSVKHFAGMPGTEVLWLMLFDTYRATGKRDAFVAMEMDYARRFERQPPVWRDVAAQVGPVGAGGAILFKGDLVATNAAAFDMIALATEKTDKPRFDFSKVKDVDVAGSERLLAILARGKRIKHPVEMLGLDTLIKLLDPKVKAKDQGQPFWGLLLECYQRQGKQEVFDELALEFAITFEISPPSYEAPPVTKKGAAVPVAKAADVTPNDGVFYLSGNQTGGGKIEGLDAYLSGLEKAVIDMSGVTRIDFACAGVMFTSLQPACMRGVSIVIRHPSYLVAALLKVVGLTEIATIVNSRY